MLKTVKVILDSRRMKRKTMKFPLKLRVIHQCITKDYQTRFELTEGDFAKLTSPRISDELQSIKIKLKLVVKEAETFIDDNLPFNFYEFEKDFVNVNLQLKPRKLKEDESAVQKDNFDYSPYYKRFPILLKEHSIPGRISFVYFEYIKKLLQEERIGNAINYQESYVSITKFRENVLFTDITISFLIQYEQWMIKRNCNKSTIGFKLRPLRAYLTKRLKWELLRGKNVIHLADADILFPKAGM